MKVLLIIPAYNESQNIEKLIQEIRNYPQYDYVVINDCSRDDTKAILEKISANYIDLGVNLGIGGAVQTGYKYAFDNGYDIAIQVDGDGQHDITYVSKFVEALTNDECDIAIGSRFILKEGFQSSVSRRIGISILSMLINICCGCKIYDVTSGFRAVNKKYIQVYMSNYPQDYPEPEAIISAVRGGGRIKEIPVVMKERENGKSSIRAGKSLYYMIKVSLAIIICRLGCRQE